MGFEFSSAASAYVNILSSFLNDIDRIAVRDYEPTNDDVVRARLRTLGVQEHRIKFNKGERH